MRRLDPLPLLNPCLRISFLPILGYEFELGHWEGLGQVVFGVVLSIGSPSGSLCSPSGLVPKSKGDSAASPSPDRHLVRPSVVTAAGVKA